MAGTYNIAIRADAGIDKYPAKSHARRVADKIDSRTSLILLRGEKAANWMNSDMARPFRQDRFFYYLSGSNDPGCWLTYHTHTDILTLWLPPVNLDRAFYEGAGTTVEEALERYDIDEAKYIKGEKVHCNLGQYVHEATKLGPCAVTQIPKMFLGKKLMDSITESSFHFGLRDAMIACRGIKDEHEIALIRKANEITAKAHVSVLKALHGLKTEAQVEAVYTAVCLAAKAKQQSYGPICGSGPNAAQLHYMTNLDDFGDRQVLLVDAGAEWRCYASDVTRTMPINPKKPGHWQSKEAEAIYKVVENIQEACIDMLGPGVQFFDVAWHSSHMALDALLKLGILKGKREEVFKAGTWMAFYPHGLGHHVGLEVHDLPPRSEKADVQKQGDPDFNPSACSALIPSKFRDRASKTPNKLVFKPAQVDAPLAPGMVMTVEPGIYFNKFMLERKYLSDEKHRKFIDVDVLKNFYHVGGVRIEDCILITEKGYENLTTAPKGEEMLKVIRDAAAEAAAATKTEDHLRQKH